MRSIISNLTRVHRQVFRVIGANVNILNQQRQLTGLNFIRHFAAKPAEVSASDKPNCNVGTIGHVGEFMQ